jgi:hypothetical protein
VSDSPTAEQRRRASGGIIRKDVIAETRVAVLSTEKVATILISGKIMLR